LHPLLVNALETFKLLIKGERSAPVYDGTSTLTTDRLNKPEIDGTYVDNQQGNVEVSTYQKVSSDPQLNGAPSTVAEDPMRQLNNGSPASDVTNEENAWLTKQNRGTIPSVPSATPMGPSISDGQGRPTSSPNGPLAVEDHLNKITVSSKKTLTIEELRLYYPNVVDHLIHYGVLTVDKDKFVSFYKECTRKAMLLQKPISEIIKDA
jgi:hypothetical protein